MDSLRARFGTRAVETGYTFGKGSKGRPPRGEEVENFGRRPPEDLF